MGRYWWVGDRGKSDYTGIDKRSSCRSKIEIQNVTIQYFDVGGKVKIGQRYRGSAKNRNYEGECIRAWVITSQSRLSACWQNYGEDRNN